MHTSNHYLPPFLFGIVSVITIAISLALLLTPYASMAFLPGVALVFFILLGNNLEWGYYTIAFLLPFAAYRSLSGPLEFVRIHWLLAIGILIVVFLRQVVEKSRPLHLRSSLWPWLAVYFALSLVSALFSNYPAVALKTVGLQAVAYIFIALGMMLVSRKGFQTFLPNVIVASISLGSLFASLGFFFNISLFAEKVDGTFKRGLGLTTDPNSLSLMILFVTPFLAYRLMRAKTIRSRFFVLLLLFVNFMGLVTTYSRGGLILLALLSIFILGMHIKMLSPRKIGLVLAIMGLIAATSLAAIPPSYWERQISLVKTDKKDLSLKRRASYLLVAGDAFLQHPVLGSGPGTFKELYAQSPYADKFVRSGKNRKRPAHNTYVEVLIGGGLPSLFVFLGALAAGLGNYTRAKRRFEARGDKEMALLVSTYRMSYIALLLFLMLFSDLFQKYLLLSLGLSQVAFNLSEDSPEASPEDSTELKPPTSSHKKESKKDNTCPLLEEL
ncbi:MAG: O-antigen ligase family protein [Desulfovibrio sp.]